MIRYRYITTKLLLLLLLLTTGAGEVWADTYVPTVKMTYVDYNNPTTSYGEIASGSTARAGYNAVGDDGIVGFANTGWNVNHITYIQVDASGLPAGCEIASATLSLEVSGSTDSKRTTAWGVGYNTSTWSSTMTYNTADRSITTLGELQWTSTKLSETFETKNFDITAALADDADRVVTIVVYETAAAGGYVKNPSVAINYNPLYSYTVNTNNGTTLQSGTAFKSSSVFYNYPEFELKSNALYKAAAQGSNPWYGKTFTLTENNQVETVSYSSHQNDVIYYSEAEKIAGCSPSTSGNADIRCSDGKGAFFTAATKLATLPAGAYKIWGQVWGNSGITFSISAPQSGGRNNVWACGTTGSLTGHESLVFQTETGDFIINSAGNKSHVLDNIYVQALLAFKAITRDPVTKGATPKPDIFPSDRTGITYEIRSLGGVGGGLATKIATVASDGTVTTLHRGTVVLRAKKTIDEMEYYTDHIIPITGGADASFTWTTDGDKETFTLTGNGDMEETKTSPSGRITVAFGNPDETQIVETEESYPGIYSIDTNGYSHAYHPEGIPTMGTYYTFDIGSENGQLKTNVLANQNTNVLLVDADGNTLETKAIAANTWTDLTFDTYLGKNSTYYVYSQAGTLYLNNFSFEKKEVVVINLVNQSLEFFPGQGSNNNRLDRSLVDGFDIICTGNSGTRYAKGVMQLKNNVAESTSDNGCITIKPRIAETDKSHVKITSVILYTSTTAGNYSGTPELSINDGAATFNITSGTTSYSHTFSAPYSSELSIKLTSTGTKDQHIVPLEAIIFTYTIDDGYLLTKEKQAITLSAPAYVYDSTGDNVTTDITFEGQNAFYGDVDIAITGDGFASATANDLNKYLSDGKKTHITNQTTDNPYQVTIGDGVGKLTATYAGNAYFTPASATTRLYSRDYVETNVEMAAGATYTVPAANGVSFAVTTSGGTINLTGTFDSPSTNLANDEKFKTNASGDAVTITNTGASAITIKMIEVSRKKPELEFGYRSAAGAGSDVLFTSSIYTPDAFSITSETEAGVASKYKTTGTYAITQAVAGVSINASTGELTISSEADNGLLKVALTVNPEEAYKATYAPITETIELKIVDGMWDFRTYSRAEHNTMYNSIGWYGQSGGWYASRDNAEFEDILRNDNTPLPRALALQSMGKHRLLHSDHGYLHLRGRGVGVNESPNGGGQVSVPVKAGMLVEVNSYSEEMLSEMEIDGVTDLEGNDVTLFYVNNYVNNDDTKSQYFLAKSDGYIIVRNPSINLELHIRYIKVSAEMAFEYGEKDESGNIITYVDAQVGKWTNRVMNQGTTTMTYSRTDGGSGSYTVNSTTGEVTIESGQYGTFTVTATGSGTGILAGKTGSYTANVIGLDFQNAEHNLGSSEANTFNLIEECIQSCTNTSGADDDGTLKNKVVFSLVDASPSVTLSGSTLTIGEVGTVKVKATLGSIEKTFTCTLNGGTLADGLNPVIANDATSYTITIEGGDTHKFKLKDMYDAIMGDLRESRSSLKFYKDGGVEVDKETVEVESTMLRIELTTTKDATTVPIEKGGVIPIYASYVYNATTYDIKGTLTVAYTSHTWDFQHNLLTEPIYGYTGLPDWWTNNGSKTAAWNSDYATIDEPTDDGAKRVDYNWKFVRKIGGHPESSIIYYYNHPVEGQNALVIPETEGLHLFSSPSNRQMGVEMLHDGGVARVPYDARNLMLLRGGKLTIPKLKKGQWVEVRWTRHKEEMGERILMTNLSDAAGTPITSTYKIGNTFYNLPWSTSTYMFQATNDGDVTFEVADNIYVSIQEIILHEPKWDFQSSFAEKLRGYDDTSEYTEEQKAAWTGDTAPKLEWQYIWDDQGSHTVTVLQKQYQNAPNAPQKWTFEMDEMLKRSGATMVATGEMDQEAYITYNGGWGKVKVTMTSYSQNMKYVANQKSWTITFGQAPKQTYPYTWDFTKFFSNTLGSTNNENTWAAVSYDAGTAKPLRVAIYNNHSSSNYGSDGWPNSYNKADYDSYYVEGAQLVSYGLRDTNNGVIRETEGLGFILDADNDPNYQPDQNMLILNMTNTVNTARQAVNGQTWITDTGEDATAKHTNNSHLTIGSGGKVIVPKPNDADNFANYYIYIMSSHKPTAATSVTDRSTDSEVPTGVYKYQFSANENAVFTFESTDDVTDSQLSVYGDGKDPTSHRKYTDIYAIAVTKDYKSVKRLNEVGWATESRDYAVDYSLDSLLTNLPIRAYSVIARSSNPIYSTDKTKTTVRLQDRSYVVPARQGLVLKQVKDSPGADGSTYIVPLFVPAVTTAIEPDYTYANNLMRPNLTERVLDSETEKIDGTTYTRFILSEKYMTWRKEDATVSYDEHFTSALVPGFYRMHIYGNSSYDGGTNRNTLGANKAYLVLPSDKINDPIWEANSPVRRFEFIGIEGVSDMEEIIDAPNPSDTTNKNAIYSLSGLLMGEDESVLAPGIYIRNGKKFMVK